MPPLGTWRQVLSESFNGQLDLTRWTASRYGTTGNEAPFNPSIEGAFYAARNVGVSGGYLKLTLKPEAATVGGVGYTYSSGCVTTRPGYQMLPGDYLEARIRVPAGDGVWPAFWLLPGDGRWPPEIDVFEFFDTAKQSAPRFNYHRADRTQTGPQAYGSGDYRDAFHAYGLHRGTDGTLTPYLDGVAHPEVAATGADLLPQYVLINLAMYAGCTPPTTVLSVDSVSAWRPA